MMFQRYFIVMRLNCPRFVARSSICEENAPSDRFRSLSICQWHNTPTHTQLIGPLHDMVCQIRSDVVFRAYVAPAASWRCRLLAMCSQTFSLCGQGTCRAQKGRVLSSSGDGAPVWSTWRAAVSLDHARPAWCSCRASVRFINTVVNTVIRVDGEAAADAAAVALTTRWLQQNTRHCRWYIADTATMRPLFHFGILYY